MSSNQWKDLFRKKWVKKECLRCALTQRPRKSPYGVVELAPFIFLKVQWKPERGLSALLEDQKKDLIYTGKRREWWQNWLCISSFCCWHHFTRTYLTTIPSNLGVNFTIRWNMHSKTILSLLMICNEFRNTLLFLLETVKLQFSFWWPAHVFKSSS